VRTKVIPIVLLAFLTITSAAGAKSWRVSGAIVHMRQDEYREAVELLDQEVAENPNNAEAYAYLGDAHANLGEYKDAADAWARAEEIYGQKKKHKELEKIEQSRLYFWDKAFRGAGGYFNRAMSFGNEEFVPEEGETVEGDLDKAAEGFIATYHVFSGHPRTVFLLGLTYEKMAEVYGARDADETVAVVDLDLETGAAVERDVKAGEYVDELWEKALAVYEKAVELKQADIAGKNWDEKNPLGDYLIKVANVAIHMEQYERALSIIDPLLEETPGDFELLNTRAAILKKLGRMEEVAAIYEKMAAITEDAKLQGEIYGQLGLIYLDEDYAGRDPKKAIEVLEKGLVASPDDYRIYLSLGRAYGEIGEYEKGKEYLKKGEELYDRDHGAD
jgi:tetratricopeptide (TPR) repeat protein